MSSTNEIGGSIADLLHCSVDEWVDVSVKCKSTFSGLKSRKALHKYSPVNHKFTVASVTGHYLSQWRDAGL